MWQSEFSSKDRGQRLKAFSNKDHCVFGLNGAKLQLLPVGSGQGQAGT